jgi:hypothetical protein
MRGHSISFVFLDSTFRFFFNYFYEFHKLSNQHRRICCATLRKHMLGVATIHHSKEGHFFFFYHLQIYCIRRSAHRTSSKRRNDSAQSRVTKHLSSDLTLVTSRYANASIFQATEPTRATLPLLGAFPRTSRSYSSSATGYPIYWSFAKGKHYRVVHPSLILIIQQRVLPSERSSQH